MKVRKQFIIIGENFNSLCLRGLHVIQRISEYCGRRFSHPINISTRTCFEAPAPVSIIQLPMKSASVPNITQAQFVQKICSFVKDSILFSICKSLEITKPNDKQLQECGELSLDVCMTITKNNRN